MIEKLKIINEKYIEEYKENPKELKKYENISSSVISFIPNFLK